MNFGKFHLFPRVATKFSTNYALNEAMIFCWHNSRVSLSHLMKRVALIFRMLHPNSAVAHPIIKYSYLLNSCFLFFIMGTATFHSQNDSVIYSTVKENWKAKIVSCLKQIVGESTLMLHDIWRLQCNFAGVVSQGPGKWVMPCHIKAKIKKKWNDSPYY